MKFLLIINQDRIMNISLTPILEELVRKKVDSGLYNNASEVIREALRLMEHQDELRNIKLEKLKAEISKGIEQADQGKFSKKSINQIFEQGKKRAKKKAANQNG